MFESDFCKITYIVEKNAILCQWKQYCQGDDYRNPLYYGLDLIEKYRPKLWITDTTHGFESEAEDTRWLVEEFIPKTIGSSIEKIIFIMPDGSLLKEEIEGQAEVLGHYFDVSICEAINKVN